MGKKMDAEFCMKMHVKQHTLAINHIRECYKKPVSLDMEMQCLPMKLADKVYAETGIDSKELD